MTTLPPEDPNEPGAEQAAQPEQAASAAQPEQPAQPAQPAAPQYQAPPAGAYQQPQYEQPAAPQYQQHVADPLGNIQLNYWLSVFFAWIPALIFWIIEKDKGDRRALAFHVSNLNFSLVRTIVGVAISVLGFIPYIGWLISVLLWIASIVLFVFHIIAAAKVSDAYRNGGSTDPFIFNIPMVK